jgi:hypothetical protein
VVDTALVSGWLIIANVGAISFGGLRSILGGLGRSTFSGSHGDDSGDFYSLVRVEVLLAVEPKDRGFRFDHQGRFELGVQSEYQIDLALILELLLERVVHVAAIFLLLFSGRLLLSRSGRFFVALLFFFLMRFLFLIFFYSFNWLLLLFNLRELTFLVEFELACGETHVQVVATRVELQAHVPDQPPV